MAVIVTAVQGVVGLVGTAVGLAMLAKLLTATLLKDSPVGPPDALCFGLFLASDQAVLALPFALSFLFCFSTMMRSIASRFGSSI